VVPASVCVKNEHLDNFSRRTPLNFLAAFFFAYGFFTPMNSPDVLPRFVQVVTPPSLVPAF
jgi:hypothetical protein